MSINITSHQGEFSCHGCHFYANKNELLVVGEYWEESEKATDKEPLQGFGRASFYKLLDLTKKAILEAIQQEYGESVAKTGIELLGVPTLVMKFTLE